MADENHRELAKCIKNVHQTLRLEAKKVGEETAWLEHCQKTEVLQNYAQAMQQLATEFWERNANDEQNTGAISRVQWVAKQCEQYFFNGGLLSAFDKEVTQCRKFNLETNDMVKLKPKTCETPNKLRVLDVGSCYNPFQKFSKFDVVAIDISPASSDVYQCDFLSLKVLEKGSRLQNPAGKITEIPAESFNVVIFSLLLEYLPSSKQRYACCSKASKLLVSGGLLCIVTPDSKHATANSGIMKKWKYALANEGLLRIEYDKLPHLHCMIYRKCVNPTLPIQWLSSSLKAEANKGKVLSDSPEQWIVIPQDFHSYSDPDFSTVTSADRDNDETIAAGFENLPNL